MAADVMEKPKAKVDKKSAIKTLLGQLSKCKDKGKAHGLRTKLRRLGHTGGLRSSK